MMKTKIEAMMNAKIEALVKYLEIERDEITEGYDSNHFEIGNTEYIVLTDTEADEETKGYIKESLWAFNADFILSHSKIGNNCNKAVIKAFQKMQGDLCENANELVFAMIEDFEDFVSDAIEADGRGHFLSSYDGEENEEKVNGQWFYIYRTN